jgi:hypothetical protein
MSGGFGVSVGVDGLERSTSCALLVRAARVVASLCCMGHLGPLLMLNTMTRRSPAGSQKKKKWPRGKLLLYH